MNTVGNQKGASIIAVIAIMLIFAVMGAALVSLVTTGSDVSVNQLQSEQALYIAEGGMERALYRLKTGTLCSSLTENNVLLAQGNFDITVTNYTLSNTLSAGIVAGDTTIPLTSTAGFAPVGRIVIETATESEIIDYYGISGNNLTNALRGVAGTTAVAHLNGDPVAEDQCRIVSTGEISSGLLTTATRVVERSMQNPGAMIVYAKGAGDNTPYFRRWDGTQWGLLERQATPVGAGNTIQYLVLKFARTRNEAILGTLDSSGDIRVQVWNGNTNIWSATTLLANIGASDDYRGFDIEYETANDRAIVVYNDGTGDPDYRIWDGTTWSAAANIVIPTGGDPVWIELAPYPLLDSTARNNEIAMIVLTDSGTPDVYGMRWTGTAWDDMVPGVGGTWDGSTSTSTQKAIDVAYEQQTGRAMFIWGDATDDRQRWRIWDGAVLNAINDLDIAAMSGTERANWVKLAPDPTSNRIMYGVQDSNTDLNTRLWSGAAWDGNPPHAEHDPNTEDVADRNFDIVFETNSAFAGQAWLVWGNGADVSRKQWDGAAWGGATTFGDDAALVQLMAHPRTGTIFTGIYQATGSGTDDIRALQNVGGAWSAETTIWNGPITTNLYERVFIAVERYIPNIFWREVF